MIGELITSAPGALSGCVRQFGKWVTLYILILSAQPGYSQYETYLPGFSQVIVTNGLSNPTTMAFAPDGRIFVAEQGGKLRVIKNGTLLPTPFVQLSVYSEGEAGLIGVAIDPHFDNNHYVYLYYTVAAAGYYHNRISRFTATGDVAVAGSETLVLDLNPLNYAEQHNGGAMNFGPDGKLYVGVGDSHNPDSAQNLDTYLGKILRINPDGSVPSGNPFTTGSDERKRIWAYGLRNPYSFSIHPVTGYLFINDVGESSWEEINKATVGGLNFGWPLAEGASTNPAYTNPIFAYPHTDSRCAITGGVIFQPTTTTYPASFFGSYFYQDFCTSAISTLNLSDSTLSPVSFAENLPGLPVSLKVGSDGNLYFFSRNNNSLYKIIYTTNLAPAITSQPANTTVPQGRTARFAVSASGATPFSYQWQKNRVNIAGATSFTYAVTNTVLADTGWYRVVIKNSVDSVISDSARLVLSAYDALPIVTINTPLNHTIYRAGDVIRFSGAATDFEEGILPPGAFVWTVEFHHNTHYHDGPPIASGISSGQFTIPDQGETSANVFYRLILTVTDSLGGSSSTSVDIDPHVVPVTFMTNPAGLPLYVDGQPISTPLSRSFVSGLLVDLSATTSATVNNAVYVFNHWSPGIGEDGRMTVPDSNTTYTAVYVHQQCTPPAGLPTRAITDTSATLAWYYPDATDSTRYEIRWRSADSSTAWASVGSLTATNGSGVYSLTGLTNMTRYEWQIRSFCSSTDSSAFSPSQFFHAATPCADQHTVRSGSWADPTVWSCNRIPVGTDVVHLRHEVSIPVNYTAYGQGLLYELPVQLIWKTGSRLLLNQ